MFNVDANILLDVFYWFSRIEGIHDVGKGNASLDQKVCDNEDKTFIPRFKSSCSGLVAELEKLNARVTKKAVERILVAIDDKDFTYGDLGESCREINSRLQDELSDIALLTLSAGEQSLFEPKEPLFGKEFENKFPSAVFELSEAGKCMALGRATAAVFHFMRTMEIGVRAVARSLQIPDPTRPAERNWGAILKAIKDGIESRWPSAATRMHGDAAEFESLYASLDAVKNPWRNATMHVENKYTDEEAGHIFAAVRGFMKKLASRMDENGDPKP